MKRNCDNCGREYEADDRNVKRGWGLCCSKSCAAQKRERERNVSEVDEAAEMLNESVPDKVRLKWALQQLGKQLSHIQELEDTVKQLNIEKNELLELTKEERKEIKKNRFYQSQFDRMQHVEKKHAQLKKDYEILLVKHLQQVKTSTEQVKSAAE